MHYLEWIKLQLQHKILYVIENFISTTTGEITQFSYQFNLRLILQVVKGVSRVLQKLLKYFNGTVSSTFFVLPATGAFPVILILDWLIQMHQLAHFYNIAINFLMFLSNYCCIQLNYTSTSQHPDLFYDIFGCYLIF